VDLRSATQQMRRDGMDYIAISRELEIPLADVIAYSREVAPGPKRQAPEPKPSNIEQLQSRLDEALATIDQLNRELRRAPPNDLQWSRWMTASAVSVKLRIPGHHTVWRACALGHDLEGRYFEARYVRPTDTHVKPCTTYLIRYSLLPSDIKREHQR